MTKILLSGVALLALAACAERTPVPKVAVGSPAASTATKAAARPAIGAWGFDLAGMDLTVAPGDDFVTYAGGGYLKTLEIPADRSNYGMFTRLRDLSQERTRALIEAAATSGGAPGSEAQKVGDFFASFMDEAAIEARGLSPLQPQLDRIAGLSDKSAFARLLGDMQRSYGPSFAPFYVNQDAKAPDRYIAYLVQDGLGLPDRDYYLVDNPKFTAVRTQYLAHISRMLELVGVPAAQAGRRARAIMALEHDIARVHWNRVDSRDDDKTYNKWTLGDFARKAPGFDWQGYFAAAGLDGQEALIVAQPSSMIGMARLVRARPLAVWKDWLLLHTLKDSAPVLPKAFVDEDFAFDGTVLTGQPENQPRWKRGVDAVNGALGEAVGKLYVARHFPPEAKAAADKLVANLIAAMDARLANLTWMTPETKAKARAKLAAFTPKIGYPAKWRDYSALNVVRGDAFGNAERAACFEYERNLAKLGRAVDRDEWFMTPMTVNAYANPTMNEIVFPAAILQPPFFDPAADPAVNYGGIGMVIGHEISHHFDDQGRKYDAEGRLSDWWTAEDVARFKRHTDQVVAQYGTYAPLPGVHINGALTLGENIADLAGLTVAYDAYRRALDGQDAPILDGMTGDQRFFLGFAQVWRHKYRDAALQQQLATGPHTPGHFRPYVVRNLDAWYGAFNVQPGQRYYLPPDARIRVW